MEDDKYQPCYIPTNNLQVASSLRGCFSQLIFLFFFFWVTDVEHIFLFLFFERKATKTDHSGSRLPWSEKSIPCIDWGVPWACRRLMPNCRSRFYGWICEPLGLLLGSKQFLISTHIRGVCPAILLLLGSFVPTIPFPSVPLPKFLHKKAPTSPLGNRMATGGLELLRSWRSFGLDLVGCVEKPLHPKTKMNESYSSQPLQRFLWVVGIDLRLKCEIGVSIGFNRTWIESIGKPNWNQYVFGCKRCRVIKYQYNLSIFGYGFIFFVLCKGTITLFRVWGGFSILVPQTPIGLRQNFLTTWKVWRISLTKGQWLWILDPPFFERRLQFHHVLDDIFFISEKVKPFCISKRWCFLMASYSTLKGWQVTRSFPMSSPWGISFLLGPGCGAWGGFYPKKWWKIRWNWCFLKASKMIRFRDFVGQAIQVGPPVVAVGHRWNAGC